MREAFLAAAVSVLIFGAIAGITARITTLLGNRINRRGRRKCDPLLVLL
jgi:archaellum component FlaG (FlaF/FlaG flagellin family)